MSEEAACGDPEEAMEGEELRVQLGEAYPCRTKGGAYLTQRQSEGVGETRLDLSEQVTQKDGENNSDQKISEAIQTSEEDAPETKKVKVDAIEMESSSKLAPSNTSKTPTGGPGTLTKPVKIVKTPPLVNCIDHDEKLKLFCKEDGALCCVICRDSLKHQGHKFLPVPDAVEVYRGELSTLVGPLEEALKEANELTSQQSEKNEQLQSTVTECRQHIVSEFGNLYNFLKERKEKLLEHLQDQRQRQREEMETNAAKMEENRNFLKEAIAVANQKKEEINEFYFLDGIQDFIKKCQKQQEAVASSGNAVIKKQPCRGHFKGPIQYFAWKQMKAVIPVPEYEEEPIPPLIEVSDISTAPLVFMDSEHVQSTSLKESQMECDSTTQSEQEVPLIKEKIPESPVCPPVIQNCEQVQPSSACESATPTVPLITKESKVNAVCPPLIQDLGPKEIWVVGDFFMEKVKDRANSGSVGPNLGFQRKTCTIHWFLLTMYGYNLRDVLNKVKKELRSPDIIFFQVEFNFNKANRLVNGNRFEMFMSKLESIARLFPNAKLIVSKQLPKPEKWGIHREMQRKDVNFKLATNAKMFQLFEHIELEKILIQRFNTGDFRPYTDDEIDLCLTSIRYALQNVMCQDINAIIEKLEATQAVDSQNQGTVHEPDQTTAGKPMEPAVKVTGDVQQKTPLEKVQAKENVKQPTSLEKLEAPGTSENSSKPKEIWIMGSSYIFSASLLAEINDNMNLGFDDQQWMVHWMGKINHFSTVLKEMDRRSRRDGIPSIVYMHIGSYDLGTIPHQALVDHFMRDIDRLASLYPKTQFIFSTILPRPEWLSSVVEVNRQRFNSTIGIYSNKCGFELATNSKLEEMLLYRLRVTRGRVNASLNSKENSVFLKSIQRSIEQAMLKLNKSAIDKQEPQKKVLCTGDTLIVVIPGTAPAASTEKDTKQKKPLECDQPMSNDKASDNQPVTSKVMQQRSEYHMADAPLSNNSGLKCIWIIGNSYICRAARQAKASSYGINLGLKKWIVHWMGRVDMNWSALLPELNNALSTLEVPSIVLIHLGDSDVERIPHDTLTKAMEDDLNQITARFPKTEFIFSTLLPKAQWLTTSTEQHRQDFNNALTRYAEELGFDVATHEDLEEIAVRRFKTGGSSIISDSEFDVFVEGIKAALEVMILKVE